MNRDPTTSDPLRAFADETFSSLTFTHSQLVAALVSQYPELQTRGFRKAIHALMPADEHESEWPAVDFIPDAYSILQDEHEIHIFEVEVTSPLSQYKRDSIGIFAEAMHSYEWKTGIHIINRYGHLSDLKWFPLYLDVIKEAARGASPEEVAEVKRLIGR